MKKFMALYMAPAAEFERMMNASPDEQGASMKEWAKWMNEQARAIVDAGAPLGKSKRVTADGVSDVKNEIGGYSIVEATSAEEAAKLFTDNPHLKMPGMWIEIIECMPMPA